MKRHIGFGLLSVMLMLTGCRDFEADTLIDGHVRVPVAYAFSSAMAGGQTRQGADALDGAGREVSILSIIPTKGGEPDGSEVSQPENPVDKDVPKAKFYHYKFCNMTAGVDRCLVYGKAAEVGSGKAENGSLTISNPLPQLVPNGYRLQDISFGLESIYSETEAPADGPAWQIANSLTAVANVEGWSTSSNPYLKNLFSNFTNHGFNLPGSAASARAWLGALSNAANEYKNNTALSFNTDETAVIQRIISATTADAISAAITVDYPQGIGLPDGAAALRWVESKGKFVPQLQTTTLDNINSVSRFAYPAALYYFVNSTLRTSDTSVDFNAAYTSNDSWESVLSTNNFSSEDDSVTSSTKAVALTNPVQYAVAKLKVNLKAQSTTLPCEGGTVTFDGGGFPLRGIIVCGQRPVDYQFAQTSNSDVDVKFIYDPLVKPGCYLKTGEQQDVATTLVLQSHDGEDVDIILEFENNSGQAFKCVDGTVYPDTRFYLVGQVKATGGSGGDSGSSGRVFTKDYTTTVNMTVKSLAKAYNVLPNLLTKNLEIGVETVPQWIAATPEAIRLDDK